MAVRNDLIVDFNTSPRIITVAKDGAASESISLQDLIDTLRSIEYQADTQSYEYLVDSFGKQNLGGGVLVGITLVLNNAKIAFEARSGPTFVQCNISGGNLVAIDSVGADMDPIQTTAYTQIVKTSSSSATLQEIDAILYASYQNAVWIDVINGTSGTAKGVGTRETPSDNIADAVSIAQTQGFGVLEILGNITLCQADPCNVSGYRVRGEDRLTTTITVNENANVSGTKFDNCYLQGVLNGDNVVENCRVGNLTYISGCIINSVMVGILTLSGGVYANLFHCASGVPGTDFVIDMGGAGQSMGIIGHNGDLEIKNMTDSSDIVSISIVSGKVTLADTVTLGKVTISGVEINSNAAEAVTINMNSILIPDSAYNGKVHIDIANGFPGTIRPFGTATKPTKTFADAVTIATNNNFSEFYFKGMIMPTQDFVQTGFVGNSSVTNDIVVVTGQNFANSNFKKITLTGIVAGTDHQMEDCILSNVTGINGILERCGLTGTIKFLTGSSTLLRDVSFLGEPTIIDLNNSNAQIIMTARAGFVKFINAGAGCLIRMVCDRVTIELDSSCTAGIAQFWGMGSVTNNSTMYVVDNIVTLKDIQDRIDIEKAEVNDIAASATKFITTLTETKDGFWTRATLLFTSGQNKGQIRGIESYTSTKEIQLQTPLSYIPANGDSFSIIPARKFLTPDIIELADAVWNTTEAEIIRKMLENKVTKSDDTITIYEDDEVTPWRTYDLAAGGRVKQ